MALSITHDYLDGRVRSIDFLNKGLFMAIFCCRRLHNAGEVHPQAPEQAPQSSWCASGIRSVCILTGAATGVVIGAAAGIGILLVRQHLEKDPTFPCPRLLSGKCEETPMIIKEIIVLIFSGSMIQPGGDVGYVVANRILDYFAIR